MRYLAIAGCLYLAALVAVNCGGEEAARPGVSEDATRVRFCISGTMQGRLEPCGCASGQWGGLARRSFYLQGNRDFDILLEGGDMVSGGTELDVLKFLTALQVLDLRAHRYDALGVGPVDLKLPLADLVMFAAAYENVPMLSSDLVAGELPQGTEWPLRSHVEIDVRGTLVRIASLTMTLPEASEGLSLLPPGEAWGKALQGAEDSTLRVLMVHGEPERVREMAALTPPPDLVIGFTAAYSEPPAEPEHVGSVPVVFAGTRGRVLVDLTLARLPSGPRIGYQTVPLEGSQTVKGAMEDPGVKQIILAHRHDVQKEGVLEKLAEQRPTGNGAKYVGSESCSECHVEDYETWEETKHAHAWQTLVDAEPVRYGWPVTAYPDCVACHTVGYGERSGFVNMDRTPRLGSVGCEACHGAGSAHVESGGTTLMGRVGAASCTGCHDFEQTPDFDFVTLWRIISHG
jgi:hypothetical protein